MSYELRAKRFNVLYVIWSLGLGGAERVVINLAKGLDKSKFNPMVCCLNDKGVFADELEKEGIRIFALNKKPGLDISVIKKIYRIIKDNQIEIVHTHLWSANFWGRIAAKLAGVPVIIATEHNEDIWKKWFHFVLDRWLSCYTDRVITVSNSVKEFYISKGIPPEKIEVIYNGIEINKSQATSHKPQVREEFNIKDDETVLAIIGRLVEQKGHRYLFEALNAFDGRYKIKLLVVGDGPLKSSLQSIVHSQQLEDRVIFTGLRQDVPNILKTVNILVMPSLREGLSIVALEAMASGVPIVATSVGGNPEVIIDGETGLIIRPESAKDIKEELERLLQDKELTRRLGENAKSRVKDYFSMEKMIKNTEALYEECLSSRDNSGA